MTTPVRYRPSDPEERIALLETELEEVKKFAAETSIALEREIGERMALTAALLALLESHADFATLAPALARNLDVAEAIAVCEAGTDSRMAATQLMATDLRIAAAQAGCPIL